MDLAKVIGQVVSTVRCPELPPHSLLLVESIGSDGNPTGRIDVALDPIGAGEGEWVILTRGSAARFGVSNTNAPLDLIIAGIVDHVNSNGKPIYRKNE